MASHQPLHKPDTPALISSLPPQVSLAHPETVSASQDSNALKTPWEGAEQLGHHPQHYSFVAGIPPLQPKPQPSPQLSPEQTETEPDLAASTPEFSSASGAATQPGSSDSPSAPDAPASGSGSDPVPSLQAQRERAEALGHHFSKVSVLSPAPASGSPAQASPDLETSIQSARGGGQALAPEVQTSMGHAFGGVDFSGVRIHTDAQADTLNRSISARAFTTGQDVFFRSGEFSPGSRGGQELLAHELTHVVQQSGGQISPQAKLSIGQPGDLYEREADSMAAQVVQRLSSPPLQREQIQRQLAAYLDGQTAVQRQPLSPVMQWRMVQAHFDLSSPPQIQPLCSECAQEQEEEQLHLQRHPALTLSSQTPDLQANIFSDAWDGATDLAGDAWDTTTGAVGDAADWVGDRAEDVMEMGADAFASLVARVSPQLAELIRNGPAGMIGEQLQSGLQSWLQSLLGGVDLGSVVSQLQSGLSEVVGSLQGALSGEGSSCEAFTQGIDKLRDLAQAFMDNPAFQAIQSAFQQVGSAFEQISQMVLAPAFDALMEVGGGILDGVMNLATQIWEWGAPVRSAIGGAWDWVLEQLGVSGDGEGGIVNWLKEQAGEVWSGIKDTFGPVVEPLQQIGPVLAAFSPVGPFIAMAQYGPELIESVGWLWENRGNPEIVKSAHEEMGHTILPRLLENAQGLSQGLSQGVSTVVEQATQLSESFLQVLGSISGIPILSAAQSVIQSATDGLQGLVTFAQEQLSSAAENVTQLVGNLKTKLEPYAGLLTQIGLAVVNPSLIPVMLAGQAWVMLPDCYKGPLIDLLLDGVIGLVQAAGSLPGFGPLWGMLQSGILGFLQGVRNQDTESKVKITNKLATILSGGSPDFIIGFVKGLGQGLWEGLTDPFKLAYEAVKGLGNLVSWLVSVANQAMSAPEEPALEPVAAGTTGTAPGGEAQPGSGGPPPELGQRMSEMASELQPPVEQVSQGFMPALQEAFSGGEGLTYEGLMQKLGEASAAVEAAIQGAGEQLAQKVCEFLMQDSAEGSMGESVGWLAGTIAFEVVLAILTAGSWTAASGAMKVLKGFARILDWTGEALGVAFKALSRVGGFLLEAIQGLGRLVGNMGGAVRGVLDALQEIGEKLIRFGEELLGLAGRRGTGEVAEAAVERGARETAEATAERGTREAVESGTEAGVREGAETGAERQAAGSIEPGVRSKAPTGDGHSIKVTESGRLVRCSVCEELATRYEKVLADPDCPPQFREQLETLQRKAQDPSLADEVAQETAELDQQLGAYTTRMTETRQQELLDQFEFELNNQAVRSEYDRVAAIQDPVERYKAQLELQERLSRIRAIRLDVQGETLSLGEGDFSFASSLAEQTPSSNRGLITATELTELDELAHEAAQKNISRLREMGVEVRGGVDARQLGETVGQQKFSNIVWVFPHAKVARPSSVKFHRELFDDFFKSADGVLKTGGEIRVTMVDSPHYRGWRIEEQAAKNGFEVVDAHRLEYRDVKAAYPGYSHQQTGSNKSAFDSDDRPTITYVFRKAGT